MEVIIHDGGHIELSDVRNKTNWRGAVEPHDQVALDYHAPNLPQADKDAIAAKWVTIPVPEPDPPAPPMTNAEKDAVVDAAIASRPEMEALIQALEDALPQQRGQLRATAVAKGKAVLP